MTLDLSVTERAPAAARRMTDAANRFLESLDGPRRAAVIFPFEGDERYRWNYRPDGFEWGGGTFWHEGLRLVNMTPEQQRAALGLLDAGLSARGASRAHQIMALEDDLRLTERVTTYVPHVVRDPQLYSFAIFGEPGGAAPWAWRAGGHHLGLHFTLIDRDIVAPTPLFFGANPAQVRHGSHVGLRTLPEEEDLARELLRSLDPERKRVAIVDPTAPGDILTDAYRRADPSVPPRGLTYSRMSGEERGRLVRLIRHYVERATEEIAAAEWRNIERAGLDAVSFAWAGGEEPDQGHYYAVTGPAFMLEYDKTQDGANHIHSVWRDFTNDWGEDLLASHYADAHRG
jgi:Protein of unknown function (DUF3500)